MIRPVVFDFEEPSLFLTALREYHKATRRGFSVRSRLKHVGGCSSALVTQVLKGERKLKRDQLPNFAKIFLLTSSEVKYLDELLRTSSGGTLISTEDEVRPPAVPKNHLLKSWLHPYVKDLVELSDFELSSAWMLKKLGGIAQKAQIEKAIQFLLQEGFWRRTADGKIVAEEASVSTTNEIPDEKIKQFHKRALQVAIKGLEEFPIQRRKATTAVIAVNPESVDELKSMINQFQYDLTRFIEKHPAHKTELVQVSVHLTPVGGTLSND